MRESTQALTVGGVITAVGGTSATLSPILGGLISICGLAVVWYGVRKARSEKINETADPWSSDAEAFERLALDFWRVLGTAFAKSDIHPLPVGQGDPLSSTVRTAYWPDAQPDYSDPNASLASAWVRQFTRRIYDLDGKSAFDTSEQLFAFEKIRHTMRQQTTSWLTALTGKEGRQFRTWLAEHLGPLHAQTFKLMWYVESAKAESIHNSQPDYQALRAVRAALLGEVAESAGDLRPRRIGIDAADGSQAEAEDLEIRNQDIAVKLRGEAKFRSKGGKIE